MPRVAKGTQVMRLCVQWRQLHESRVLSEPREVNSLYVMWYRFYITPSQRRTYGKINKNQHLHFGAVVSGLGCKCHHRKEIWNFKKDNGYYSKDIVTIKTRERQLDCLAMNIYREAGYESFEGKVAVAQVTLNRVEHPSFPKDVCGVIYQKRHSWTKSFASSHGIAKVPQRLVL